jgi:hypothetical protein
MISLEDFVKQNGLELQRSSPITARSYVTSPGLPCERVDEYHWARKLNGSKYDQRVYVFMYHDGSFSTSLGIDFIHRLLPDKPTLKAFVEAMSPER